MRPPKDPADFPAHTTRKNGVIWVYCVECEQWTKIIIVAQATAIYQQNHWPNKTEDAHRPSFHCGGRGCWADVEYLLNEAYKETLLKLAEVPVLHQRKSSPFVVEKEIQQMRLPI